MLGRLQVVDGVDEVHGGGAQVAQRGEVRALQRGQVVDEDGGREVADVLEVRLLLAVAHHAHGVPGARHRDQPLGVVRAHQERDVRAAESPQRLRDGQRSEHVPHAHRGRAVHAEEHARLAQEPLRHPEVLEVVDGEAGALVQDQAAHLVAETAGRVDDGAAQGHHRAVLLVDGDLLLAAAFAREQRHEQAAVLPPVQRAVLGDRHHRVDAAGQQPLHGLVDGGAVAEGRGGLQHHHHADGLSRRLQRVHRVRHHGLERGEVGGQLSRAQERRLAPVRARDLRHPRVVGGDHHAVDVSALARRHQRVGQERTITQALDVEVGDGVGSAAGGHDGDDPKPVLHEPTRFWMPIH